MASRATEPVLLVDTPVLAVQTLPTIYLRSSPQTYKAIWIGHTLTMAQAKAEPAPTASNNFRGICLPAMPERAFPFAVDVDARIRLGKASSTSLGRRLMQPFQSILVAVQRCCLRVRTGRTTAAFQDLARLGIPAMSLRTLEVLPDSGPQIVALETDQIALSQLVEKALPNDGLLAQLARCDAGVHRGRVSLELMTMLASEQVLRVSVDSGASGA